MSRYEVKKLILQKERQHSKGKYKSEPRLKKNEIISKYERIKEQFIQTSNFLSSSNYSSPFIIETQQDEINLTEVNLKHQSSEFNSAILKNYDFKSEITEEHENFKKFIDLPSDKSDLIKGESGLSSYPSNITKEKKLILREKKTNSEKQYIDPSLIEDISQIDIKTFDNPNPKEYDFLDFLNDNIDEKND